MDRRLFPISREFFDREIRHLIEDMRIKTGRPPRINNYQVFCAILYVLRTGVAWRDLPCVRSLPQRRLGAAGTQFACVSSAAPIVECGGIFSSHYSRKRS